MLATAWVMASRNSGRTVDVLLEPAHRRRVGALRREESSAAKIARSICETISPEARD
jgi:hypothetical protein